MTPAPNFHKIWSHILRTSPGSLGWFIQELIGLPSDRLDGESQLLVILEVAIRKLLHLKKWAGGIEMDFEKRAGGIERAGGFFENCPKKVVYAKKIFIWPISANLTVLNNCQYSQGSEKKDWGEIPGLLVELLISKVGHNSVGHTVYNSVHAIYLHLQSPLRPRLYVLQRPNPKPDATNLFFAVPAPQEAF